MKIAILSGGTIAVLVGVILFSPTYSFAQNIPSSVAVSHIGIRNCMITQQNSAVVIECDFVNSGDVQPDLHYSVQLMRAGFNTRSVVDEKVYPQILSLAEGQTIHKTISYTIPTYASGFLEVWVTARTSDGAELAFNQVDTISAQAQNDSAEILTSTCYVQNAANEDPTYKSILQEGISVSKKDTLIAHCQVKNLGTSSLTLSPFSTTYSPSIFGQSVQTVLTSNPTLTLTSAQTKDYSFRFSPPADPEAYDTTLSFMSGNKQITNTVAIHYIVTGSHLSIQNISLDRSLYKKADTSAITTMWSGSADAHTLSVTMTDEFKNICGHATQDVPGVVSGEIQSTTVDIDMVQDCINPHVSVKVLDESGTIIGQKDVSVTSVAQIQTTSLTKNQINLIAGGIAITLFLLLIITLFWRRKPMVIDDPVHNSTPPTILSIAILLVLSAPAFFMNVSTAHADMLQDTSLSTNGKTVTTLYSVDINKTVYAPGEEIDVSAFFQKSIQSDAVHSGFLLKLENEPTGQDTLFSWSNKQEMSQRTKTFSAPGTPGTYRIAFVSQYSSINGLRNGVEGDTNYIYYTVAVRKAVLNASCSLSSNTTISVGQSATWTALASGGSGTYTYAWTGTEGLSGSSAYVTKKYAKTGENSASVTVSDGSKKVTQRCGTSLSVKAISQSNLVTGGVLPTIAFASTPVRLTATAKNIGTAASGSFPLLFRIKGTGGALKTSYVESLGLNNSGAGSVTYTFPSSGTYAVQACANVNTSWKPVIRESDYTDNCGPWTQVSVRDKSNELTATCYASPTAANVGDIVTWNTNVSGGKGTYSYQWSGTDQLSGNTFSVTKSYPATGTKMASVSVSDGTQHITQRCANNISVGTLAQANLQAGQVSPTSVVVGATVTVTADASNIGNAASGSSTTLFQIHETGVQFKSALLASIPSGTHTTARAPYVFSTAGTYHIRACINLDESHNAITPESNYTDNCGDWTTVTVTSASSATSASATTLTAMPVQSVLSTVSSIVSSVIGGSSGVSSNGAGGSSSNGGGVSTPTPDPTPSPTPTPVTPPTLPPPPGPVAGLRIGTNLTGITNYTAEYPFLDYFKSAASPLNNPTLDAAWNVTSIVPGSGGAGYSINLDPAPHSYVLLYEGSTAVWAYTPPAGTNSMFGSVTVTKQSPGRMEFSASGGSINFSVNGLDPANPIRNIHIIRADQEDLYNSGEIFNPDFLALIRHFSALRTMDWAGTNGSEITSWSQRPKVTDAEWPTVPIEVEIAAANEANADLWLNIPAHADDNYIQNAVTLVHNQLSTNLKLHLEYSNEVWNSQFEQHTYAEQHANALWPASSSDWRKGELWYGYRAAQMASIAHQVYGSDADSRLSPVLATWPGWTTSDLDDEIADGVSRANLGSIGSLFKEYAVTSYFSDELGVFPGNEADRATVLGWAASGSAGLDKAFQEMEFGGLLQNNFSLANRASTYTRHAAQAHAWGLNMVIYEGGVSWYYFMAPDKAPYDAFFAKILNDPRMGPLYTKMITDFGAAGGTLLMHFSDIGSNSQWGPWGMQPDLKTSTYRSRALIQASGR